MTLLAHLTWPDLGLISVLFLTALVLGILRERRSQRCAVHDESRPRG